MRELVGTCTVCGKDVYCLDGFLNGVYEEGQLICMECLKNEKNKEDNEKTQK